MVILSLLLLGEERELFPRYGEVDGQEKEKGKGRVKMRWTAGCSLPALSDVLFGALETISK